MSVGYNIAYAILSGGHYTLGYIVRGGQYIRGDYTTTSGYAFL